MGKVRFSNMAVEDLTAIWNYTEEKWSEQQADSYYEQLIAASRRIADEPFLPEVKSTIILRPVYADSKSINISSFIA